MDVYAELIVTFEEPFWIGIHNVEHDDRCYVAKITFGPEPTLPQLYQFVLENRFACGKRTTQDLSKRKRINPKRARKQAQQALKDRKGISRSMETLHMIQQKELAEKAVNRKRQKETDKEKIFETKQQKKKQKRKGR